jgi:hypothetical protein
MSYELPDTYVGTWSNDDEKWTECYIQTLDDDLQVVKCEFVKYRKEQEDDCES